MGGDWINILSGTFKTGQSDFQFVKAQLIPFVASCCCFFATTKSLLKLPPLSHQKMLSGPVIFWPAEKNFGQRFIKNGSARYQFGDMSLRCRPFMAFLSADILFVLMLLNSRSEGCNEPVLWWWKQTDSNTGAFKHLIVTICKNTQWSSIVRLLLGCFYKKLRWLLSPNS